MRARLRELGPVTLLILPLPILLATANPFWIFTNLKFIDAWLNFGYF